MIAKKCWAWGVSCSCWLLQFTLLLQQTPKNPPMLYSMIRSWKLTLVMFTVSTGWWILIRSAVSSLTLKEKCFHLKREGGNFYFCNFFQSWLLVTAFLNISLQESVSISPQEDLNSETLDTQFQILLKEVNTSHPQEFGDMVSCNLGLTRLFLLNKLFVFPHPIVLKELCWCQKFLASIV